MTKSTTDIAHEAGFDLDGMANMLYTVRGNHAQLERFATLLKAAHLAELTQDVNMPAPVAHIAWRDGKPNYEGDDAICEDAVWPVDSDDDRESKAVVTLDQCQKAVAAAVARKDAEIARLEPLQYRKAPCHKFCEATAFEITIRALTAERNALAKDAARYRWLRPLANEESADYLDKYADDDLDAAIDAALEQSR